MSGEPENPTLRYLRRLDEKMDRILDDLGDLKRRVTSLEGQVSTMHTQAAQIHGDFAGQSIRIDRIEGRLERIEHRLDLFEPPEAAD